MNQVYLDTARLLIQVAPLILADNVFALKGGTAINLSVRDIPRLSVDLDLTFIDYRLERDDAFANNNTQQLRENRPAVIHDVASFAKKTGNDTRQIRLAVSNRRNQKSRQPPRHC